MPGRDERFTVGTLNVCGLPPRAPLLPLADRADELCQRLDASSIDVLNLQEVWYRSTLRLLRPRLPSYRYVAYRPGVVGPAGGLVTLSRMPLGRRSYRSFIGTRPTRGDLRFRVRRAAMSAVQGILMVDLAQRPVTVVNTHLVANTDDDYTPAGRFYDFQHAQVRRLNRVLSRPRRTGLAVITGDFNIASTSQHYKLIVDGGARRDPFADIDPATYLSAFLPARATALRVDYVLLEGDERRFPVLDATIHFAGPTTVDGADMYLSDHAGLSVQIGLCE